MDDNFKLHEYDELDSTQNEAKRLASLGVSRAVVVAKTQTAGRGQYERTWASNAGGLYVSFLLTDVKLPALETMSVDVGRAVRDILAELYKIDAVVKLPNDILVGGKKICGILCENAIDHDRVRYCIVGVGINCEAQAIPPELKGTACALDEFVSSFDKNELVLKIAQKIFAPCLPPQGAPASPSGGGLTFTISRDIMNNSS